MIQEALNEVLNKKRFKLRDGPCGDGGDYGRNGHQCPDGRFSGSPADEGGDGDRDHGLRGGDAGERPEGGGPFDVMEIVGTGGDEVGTFNISTTSAFVVAAGGVPVAKHGNRSVSSRSGAADVLERLGARLDLTPEQNVEVLKESQYMCFMFAQVYHTSMKNVGPVRKEMGARTIFNIFGAADQPGQSQHAAHGCVPGGSGGAHGAGAVQLRGCERAGGQWF